MSQAEIDSLRALLVETQRQRDEWFETVKQIRAEQAAAPTLYGFHGPDGWYFYPRARAAQGDTHRCRVVGIEALPNPKPRQMKEVEVSENLETAE